MSRTSFQGRPARRRRRRGRPPPPRRRRHGDVPGLGLAHRQRQTDQLGAHGVERGGLGVDAPRAVTRKAREPRAQGGNALDHRVAQIVAGIAPVVVGHLVLEPLEQLPELQLAADPPEVLGPGIGTPRFFQIDVDVDVLVDGDQSTAQQELLSVLLDRLALTRSDPLVVESLQQAVDALEGRDQLDRRLLSDPGNAGHVVALVAHEREHVAVLGRPHPFLPAHRALVDRLVLDVRARGRLENRHARTDQRVEILVARVDPHVVSAVGASPGQRTDNIVGLVTLLLDDRHLHGLEQLAHARDLGGEVRGRGWPVRLVRLVHLVAERGCLHVEGTDHAVGPEVLEQADDGVRRAEARGRDLTVRGRQRLPLHGEMASVDQGRAVDEHDLHRSSSCR